MCSDCCTVSIFTFKLIILVSWLFSPSLIFHYFHAHSRGSSSLSIIISPYKFILILASWHFRNDISNSFDTKAENMISASYLQVGFPKKYLVWCLQSIWYLIAPKQKHSIIIFQRMLAQFLFVILAKFAGLSNPTVVINNIFGTMVKESNYTFRWRWL